MLYELQSGFRSAYSTDTCLINLFDHIKSQTSKGLFTGMVMIDLQKKPEYPEGTTDHGLATGTFYHLATASRVHLFCNLQRRLRTHTVLMIGWYELLGNPTTSLIEPPILIGIDGVLYEGGVYVGADCITVDLHESDKRNALLGPLPINTELYLISTQDHVIEV